MSLYSLLLAGMIGAILLIDFARFGRHLRRMFWLELLVFALGLVFVLQPGLSQRIADALGVGRGVDAIVYVLLVWLVRESIVSRYLRWESEGRNTELVRALALQHPVREPR